MAFPYILQLENVDTNQKFYHTIKSADFNQVFNQNEEINYDSIIQYILMYEPQCDKDMLLLMYQEGQLWIFMSSQFFIDLKNANLIEENIEKVKRSKYGSKISSAQQNCQPQSISLNSTKHNQKKQIILHIRFQCQLWVEEPQNFADRSLIMEKSLYSQREQGSSNLAEKLDQIKTHIKQMDSFSHQLHTIEAESLGINIFWASPFFSTDGISRKPPKGFIKEKYVKDNRQILKNSIKCIPYVNAVTEQIVKSKKKIVLNIDQFNNLSFARRNIFKVVYLICHTEVTEIKTKQLHSKNKGNRNTNNNFNTHADFIGPSSKLDKEQNVQSNKEGSSTKDRLQHIQENKQEQYNQYEQDKEFKLPKQLKFKKTESFDILEDTGLEDIQEENQEDRMTERKPSQDNYRKDSVQFDYMQNMNHFDYSLQPENYIAPEQKISKKKESSDLQDLFGNNFGIKQDSNLFNIFQHEQYEYTKNKEERTKIHRNRLLRSNSIKSVSSGGQSKQMKNSKSKSKNSKKIKSKKELIDVFQKDINTDQQIRLNNALKNYNLKKNKKYNRKQKNTFKNQAKNQSKNQAKNQSKNGQNQERQTLTYLIGQSKIGQLLKITPSDLDQMLTEKKLENIEILIFHTSYPYAHLPILKKHANNIIVINSNPMYPQACTVYFVKYFFRYLLTTKNIKIAHEKALSQLIFLYRNDHQSFLQKFSRIFSGQKQSFQKLLFQPSMQIINKKFIHGGPYICCCYHDHEQWCTFKGNKSTSKFAQAHYKFHMNRCGCNYENWMQHSCQQKFETLNTYNIIDKKKYTSSMVYDCCCLGVKLGKYKHKRKNLEYNQIINQSNIDDPHCASKKFVLFRQYDKQQANYSSEYIQNLNILERNKSEKQRNKQELQISQGEVEGSYSPQFLMSFQYLSENQLIGNRQIIMDLLEFFVEDNSIQPVRNQQLPPEIELKKIQSKGSNQSVINSKIMSKKQIKTTNSMIKQSVAIPAEKIQDGHELRKLYSNEPRICNMHGQNSSGRKTISKYLAHVMIIKNLYDKVFVKYFSKAQDLKYIENEEKVSTFYILIYKSTQRHQQINLNQISLTADMIPNGLSAIIVTNKKIKFDKTIKNIYETPKPFNKEQIQTYIKMYEHLSPNQKSKLKTFMDLTEVSLQKQLAEEDKRTKIYANRIDPFEIIAIIRRSSYQNLKYERYLQSISKIHIQSLPQYIFIAGVIYSTLKSLTSGQSSFMRRKQKMFTQKIEKVLKSFMVQNKSFFLFFDAKRNKNKARKRQSQNSMIKIPRIDQNAQKIDSDQKIKKKHNESQQQKQFKDETIRINNISQFYELVFQKFQRQIARRCLDPLKIFIFYTTLSQNNFFSLRQSKFSLVKQKTYHKHIIPNLKSFKTRSIVYEKQFFQATSLNPNSFIAKTLKRQIKEYGQYLNKLETIAANERPINENQGAKKDKQSFKVDSKSSKKTVQKQFQPNLKQKQDKGLVNFAKKINQQFFQMQKLSLNQFFIEYSSIFRSDTMDLNYKKLQQPVNKVHQANSPKNLIKHRSRDVQSGTLQNFVSRFSQCEDASIQFKSLKQKVDSEVMRQTKQKVSKSEKKNRKVNFQQDQKHLQNIMSAGLLYLRSTICSHLTYNFLEPTEAIQIIKAALILINNALILMKIPEFQAQEDKEQCHVSPQVSQHEGDYVLSENQLSEIQSQKQKKSLQQKQHQSPTPKTPLISQNVSNLNHSVRFFQDQAKRKLQQTVQNQICNLLTVKGLLYLLFKIRERCDGLVLIFTEDNVKQNLNKVARLSIVSELFIIQLHLINIYKGEHFEQKSKSLSPFKKQNYSGSIYYDRSKSINYLKQALHFAYLSSETEQILQNHILSAYIMISTSCGRKKINQNLCEEICKMKKYLDEKTVRRDSVHDLNISNKMFESQLSERMKILLKISQSKENFLKVYSIFMSFSFEHQQDKQKTQHLISFSNKKSEEFLRLPSAYQRSNLSAGDSPQKCQKLSEPSNDYTKQRFYQSQNEIHIKLLDLHHSLQLNLQNKQPLQLYLQLYKFHMVLLKDQMTNSLRFCPRYICDLYNDILKEIKMQIQKLKHKFILFFTANPIQSFKSFFQPSAKKSYSENYEDSITDKKKIEHEGKNSTIILGCDINELNKRLNQKNRKKHSQMSSNSLFKTGFQEQPSFSQNKRKKAELPQKNSYSFFALNRKLNENSLRQLSNSLGCKYLCIDTSNSVSNFKNWVIGQSEAGETLIYEREHLAQLIQGTPTNVVFICLPRSNLAKDLIGKNTKKQIIYFNFERNRQHSTEVIEKKEPQDCHISSSSTKQMINAYYRIIMLKVVILIIQKIAENQSDHSQTLVLREAFNFVISHYQFEIKNQKSEIVFRLRNQQLKQSLFFYRQFQLEQSQVTISPILVTLYEEDILFAEEIQEVKTILKHKHNSSRQFKTPIKIQHIQSFEKLFKILKFYLKDKQQYQEFYEIDVQNFKYPHNQKDSCTVLKEKKSAQSSSSIPLSLSREQSRISSQSQKKRRQKKPLQLMYEPVKYSDRWRSEFLKDLTSKDLISFFLSNKKGLVMFLNSELMGVQKNDKEDWTKKIFDNLFKLQLYDYSQTLNRLVTTVKVGFIKEGDKKISKQATLYFMQTKQQQIK